MRALRSVAIVACLIAGAACSDGGRTDANQPTSTANPDETNSVPDATSTTEVTFQGPVASAAVPELTALPSDPALDKSLGNYPLESVGYAASEFVMSGTATSFTSADALGSDGKWSVTPDATAPYTSRLVVVQPIDPADFSGTVIVEWYNVTAGIDANPDWLFAHDEMIREGDAYVAVSAQAVGVEHLATSNPERYGNLVHPGDSFAFDIFSQAGMAVRELSDIALPGLTPTRVIADGESQSALFMTTYVNAVAPIANVYSGYMLHGRGGGSPSLSGDVEGGPSPVLIRDDLSVPVLVFQSETDVLGIMDNFPARQDDTEFLRVWEVPGTAHADYYEAQLAVDDDGSMASDIAQFESMSAPPAGFTVDLDGTPLTLDCPPGLNTGQQHYVFQAALHHLVTWIETGEAPPSMPRFDIDETVSPPAYALDANGNVTGGVRSPAVDAPVAMLSGIPAPGGPGFCVFFGQTVPFSAEQLAVLYPTRDDFVAKWQQAVDDAVEAGSILPIDAARLSEVVSTG